MQIYPKRNKRQASEALSKLTKFLGDNLKHFVPLLAKIDEGFSGTKTLPKKLLDYVDTFWSKQKVNPSSDLGWKRTERFSSNEILVLDGIHAMYEEQLSYFYFGLDDDGYSNACYHDRRLSKAHLQA